MKYDSRLNRHSLHLYEGEWIDIDALHAEVERLTALLDKAQDYIALLENCQDGYYRASESEEALAWEAALTAGKETT